MVTGADVVDGRHKIDRMILCAAALQGTILDLGTEWRWQGQAIPSIFDIFDMLFKRDRESRTLGVC
jgi:hypothetical protein